MKYCSECGQPMEDSAAFCQNCGAKASDPQTVRTETVVQPQPEPVVYTAPQATYVNPPAAQRSPGKTIAGFVLGIVSMSCGIIGVLCSFLALNKYMAITCMVYAITLGLFGVGCGIPGMILSGQAASIDPSNKTRLGRIFSLVGLITGGVAIIFGIIFGIIGISSLARSFPYNW